MELAKEQVDQICSLCEQFSVDWLAVFGSASTSSMGTESDLDFLVRFQSSSRRDYYERYFGLLESLEDALGRSVDLVEESAMKNPHFIRRVRASQVQLYAA